MIVQTNTEIWNNLKVFFYLIWENLIREILMNLGICDVWHVVRLLSMHTTIRVSGWTQTTYPTIDAPVNAIYGLSFFSKTTVGGSPALADTQRRCSPQHHARSQHVHNTLIARNHSPFARG